MVELPQSLPCEPSQVAGLVTFVRQQHLPAAGRVAPGVEAAGVVLAVADMTLPPGFGGVNLLPTLGRHVGAVQLTQGALRETKAELDVAIEGNGYLEVTLPSGEPAFTRDGKLTRSAEGEISVDLSGKKSGRGAYLCPRRECLAKAQKAKRLEHALGCAIPPEVYERLAAEVEQRAGAADE